MLLQACKALLGSCFLASLLCASVEGGTTPPTLDDFEDGVLDPTLWQVDTTSPSSSVVETNGRAEITNRAILSTTRLYDPSTATLRIEAQVVFGLGESAEIYTIYTRCSGVADTGDFYRPTSGISFGLSFSGAGISEEWPGNSGDVVLTSTSVTPETGDIFDIVITDNGSDVTFEVTEVGGDGDSVSLSATTSMNDFSRVSFLNREQVGGSFMSAINEVHIYFIQPDSDDVAFEWATIGNAGNAPDPSTGFGAVAYEYRICKHEVTNAQYAEFLNSVAAVDDFGGIDPTLYNPSMAAAIAGIIRSGSVGSFSYTVVAGRNNNPVNYVSIFDIMRFINWLHNGKGSGGTESGVYDIGSGLSEIRATDAKYFFPSEDEWYKAAYHQPASVGGDSDDYWLYPNTNNDMPLPGIDANISDLISNTTMVGTFAPNFYGLYDVGGNVWEKNETLVTGSLRGIRGGSWQGPGDELQSSDRRSTFPPDESPRTGFRIASPVPICEADANLDGIVDVNDISAVLFRLGLVPGDFGYEASADVNIDGVIDVNDISYVLFRLGAVCP